MDLNSSSIYSGFCTDFGVYTSSFCICSYNYCYDIFCRALSGNSGTHCNDVSGVNLDVLNTLSRAQGQQVQQRQVHMHAGDQLAYFPSDTHSGCSPVHAQLIASHVSENRRSNNNEGTNFSS